MSTSHIAVIDYAAGNTGSVCNALRRLGAAPMLTADPGALVEATHIILPGVGAFGDAADSLRARGLHTVLPKLIADGKPFLGICVGLQLLFEGSDESPGATGLGIFAGKSVRFPRDKQLKVPHMGWNCLSIRDRSDLFAHAAEQPWVYFVHSYYVDCNDPSLITATADYPTPFTAAIGRGTVQAVQFHPEKSGQVGLSMLKSFLGGDV